MKRDWEISSQDGVILRFSRSYSASFQYSRVEMAGIMVKASLAGLQADSSHFRTPSLGSPSYASLISIVTQFPVQQSVSLFENLLNIRHKSAKASGL